MRQPETAAGTEPEEELEPVVDLADFPRLNELYGEAMGDHRPSRSTVQVAALPKGARLEIDLVARIPGQPSTV